MKTTYDLAMSKDVEMTDLGDITLSTDVEMTDVCGEFQGYYNT